jgi:lipoxygenase
VADDDDEVVAYEADFDVPADFGAVGAVLVTNEHHAEMFLEDIRLMPSSSDDDGAPLLAIRCNSWVQPKSGGGGDAPGKRVFFANKVQ